ncbi:MAG: hypothetical protein KAG12_07770, partial [Desulfuromusa sp.]|nr:hypothetical protein [Desulfuromusa sp.]
MSEVAPSLIRMQSLGVLGYGLSVVAYSHQQVFPLPAKFAAVPVTAGIYFTATIDGATPISLSYLHLRQIDGSQATVEARVAGNHLNSLWVVTAAGKVLRIFSEARDISGNLLSSDLVSETVIQNVRWDGKSLQLYAVGAQDLRAPRTLDILTILFLQTRSSGRRSIRFPLVWGLQAG